MPSRACSLRFGPVRSRFTNGRTCDDWLLLAPVKEAVELSPATETVRDKLLQGGALFFTELVRRTGLLPSQVEEALSELAALGLVTCDSFDGLRALLVPSHKRPTLGRNEGKRRRKTNLASIEFAGRWSLLRNLEHRHLACGADGRPACPSDDLSRRDARTPHRQDACAPDRDAVVEKFAWVLLRRYGIVFRRLLERESLTVTWYELGRIYRRLEARGHIRGGYFVGGVSGEQFALPEAIGLMRSIRKTPETGELVTLSAADPLNLQGILTPGPRIAALAANRILFKDGLPIAALAAGETQQLVDSSIPVVQMETALRVGKLQPALRPYYK